MLASKALNEQRHKCGYKIKTTYYYCHSAVLSYMHYVHYNTETDVVTVESKTSE